MQTEPDPAGATESLKRIALLARGVAARASEENVTFLAASVAYYAFVSLLPAAVLALVVAVTVGGQQLASAVVVASADVLTDSGQELLVTALVDGPGQGSVTLISLPLTLWGALKVLRGLDIAFSQVYGTDGAVGLVNQLRDSLVVTVSVGGSLGAMVVLGTLVAVVDVGVVAVAASYLALPALLTAAFLPMYYVFPDTDVTLREVVPGAVFAGVGWTALRIAFQAYVDLTAGGDGEGAVYGVLGAVLLFVTFLYFGATLVLVGAVVNVVLAGDPEKTAEGSGDADGRDRQDKGTDTRAK
ncbi:YihY/virulence factor BrkB family protein [Halobaculum halobium]|uniref:YihY/virulence factor BrkB family protein n=1 Tax=Halobaculum halobium TaxID=3032281 RepID=A0ABD5TC43_9EURY|nr:YihY/virulence factor BrkB family protein [Halobaculum sp. SYNS20]